MIHKPGHAQGVEFLIKELHPLQETRRQKIRVKTGQFWGSPGKPHTPPKKLGTVPLHLTGFLPISPLYSPDSPHTYHWALRAPKSAGTAPRPQAPGPVQACALTSCPASRGMYSMMASRTRHLASSASSTMAGSRDCDSCRMPITSFTQSRLEMMFSRTSGH